jgi:hypothetical protein
VLAVATGAATREELERGEPDALLESLADFGEVGRCLEA